jgi:hypothetical protein
MAAVLDRVAVKSRPGTPGVEADARLKITSRPSRRIVASLSLSGVLRS